jgi:hypothetical protein
MYFKSKSIENKKYYLDLYLNSYFKKIKEDKSNLLEEYFNFKNDNEDLIIEKKIYDFETTYFNYILKIN